MIVIIDNYDSFTFNLIQLIGELGHSIKILRSDQTCVKEIKNLNPTHIVISPGPGCPQESRASLEIIEYFASKTPILGVCLGHQSIGHIYGGTIKQLKKPVHGKVSKIYHKQETIFKDIPSPFLAARYHSLVIEKYSLPKSLKVIAETEDGILMGCQHVDYVNIQGVQFHPESLWTEYGKEIINNFLLST